MKIVVAPDSYKGSLSAVQATEYIEAGIKKAAPEIEAIKIPMADGGEGTVEALTTATNGKIINYSGITGPLGEKTDSFLGILGDGFTAIIETAAAAGINMVPENKKNPLYTTTYGVGELIIKAIDLGCREIIVGLGGSATNDGGMGMAQALGVKFTDKNGLPVGLGGRFLEKVSFVDAGKIDARIKEINIIAASDVINPLCGNEGAAYVYSPQKGASKEDTEFLERGMGNYAAVINKELGDNFKDFPGSGAAGGLGFGLLAFAGAVLKPGFEVVADYCKLKEKMINAIAVFTGEGKTDAQTIFGKVPVGVARAAKEYSIPVICLSGALEKGFEEIYNHGITAAFSNVSGIMSITEAMERAGELLEQNAYAVTRLLTGDKNRGKV